MSILLLLFLEFRFKKKRNLYKFVFISHFVVRVCVGQEPLSQERLEISS